MALTQRLRPTGLIIYIIRRADLSDIQDSTYHEPTLAGTSRLSIDEVQQTRCGLTELGCTIELAANIAHNNHEENEETP